MMQWNKLPDWRQWMYLASKGRRRLLGISDLKICIHLADFSAAAGRILCNKTVKKFLLSMRFVELNRDGAVHGLAAVGGKGPAVDERAVVWYGNI